MHNTNMLRQDKTGVRRARAFVTAAAALAAMLVTTEARAQSDDVGSARASAAFDEAVYGIVAGFASLGEAIGSLLLALLGITVVAVVVSLIIAWALGVRRAWCLVGLAYSVFIGTPVCLVGLAYFWDDNGDIILLIWPLLLGIAVVAVVVSLIIAWALGVRRAWCLVGLACSVFIGTTFLVGLAYFWGLFF